MFAADVVIIFIVLIGVSYIFFGKKKDVKEDPKFHKTIMNIVFAIAVVIVIVSLDTDNIVLPHNVFTIACYSILNNFYTLLF
ncbi:hypothetical protein [Helicobacter pylori]|uniref:hypothetical protein n=1 Tax=Helicobacter pylori TaxID=210 RepID=UPI001E2AB48D|nr:hypothetical protein [Helicobacter pylori]